MAALSRPSALVVLSTPAVATPPEPLEMRNLQGLRLPVSNPPLLSWFGPGVLTGVVTAVGVGTGVLVAAGGVVVLIAPGSVVTTPVGARVAWSSQTVPVTLPTPR